MEKEEQGRRFLTREVTRRQALKAGGIVALGLAFSKPLIETIHPPSVFANHYLETFCTYQIVGFIDQNTGSISTAPCIDQVTGTILFLSGDIICTQCVTTLPACPTFLNGGPLGLPTCTVGGVGGAGGCVLILGAAAGAPCGSCQSPTQTVVNCQPFVFTG